MGSKSSSLTKGQLETLKKMIDSGKHVCDVCVKEAVAKVEAEKLKDVPNGPKRSSKGQQKVSKTPFENLLDSKCTGNTKKGCRHYQGQFRKLGETQDGSSASHWKIREFYLYDDEGEDRKRLAYAKRKGNGELDVKGTIEEQDLIEAYKVILQPRREECYQTAMNHLKEKGKTEASVTLKKQMDKMVNAIKGDIHTTTIVTKERAYVLRPHINDNPKNLNPFQQLVSSKLGQFRTGRRRLACSPQKDDDFAELQQLGNTQPAIEPANGSLTWTHALLALLMLMLFYFVLRRFGFSKPRSISKDEPKASLHEIKIDEQEDHDL